MSDHNNSEPIPHAPMTAINTERAIAEAFDLLLRCSRVVDRDTLLLPHQTFQLYL